MPPQAAVVKAEDAAVDVGGVAEVAVELLGFVLGIEDIGPDAHAGMFGELVADDGVGHLGVGVIGDVQNAGRGVAARGLFKSSFTERVEVFPARLLVYRDISFVFQAR